MNRRRRRMSSESFSRWSYLPELALCLIVTALRNVAGGSSNDFFAFRGVCRSWRSAAEHFFPPFLFLRSSSCLSSFGFHAVLARSQWGGVKWLRARTKQWAGFSYGHLIMVDRNSRRRSSIVNPLSHAAIHLPQAPVPFSRVVLSAHPASGDCWLLGWGSTSNEGFVLCQPHQKRSNFQFFRQPQLQYGIQDVIPFGENKFVLVYEQRMVMADLVLSPEPELQEGQQLPPPPFGNFILARVDDDLWLLNFQRWVREESEPMWLNAYRLNLEDGEWVREEELLLVFRGRALLADNVGCVMMDKPEMWGGRANCIYFREMSRGALVRLSVDDMRVDYLFEETSTTHYLPEFGWFYLNPPN